MVVDRIMCAGLGVRACVPARHGYAHSSGIDSGVALYAGRRVIGTVVRPSCHRRFGPCRDFETWLYRNPGDRSNRIADMVAVSVLLQSDETASRRGRRGFRRFHEHG